MKNTLGKFELKTVKVADLKEWEINPRIHSDKGIVDVKASMVKFNIAQKMCCDKDLTICGGHARKKALLDMGVEEIEIYVAKKKLSKRDFRAVALLTNQVPSKFDTEKLNQEHDPFYLMEVGFGASEINFDVGDTPMDEPENTATTNKTFKIKLELADDEELVKLETFLVELKNKYPKVPTIGQRLLYYMKDRS